MLKKSGYAGQFAEDVVSGYSNCQRNFCAVENPSRNWAKFRYFIMGGALHGISRQCAARILGDRMKVRLVLAGLGMAAVPVSSAAGFSFVTAISSLEGGLGVSGIDEFTIGNGGQIAAFAYDDANGDLHLIYQPGNAVTTEATIVD